MNNTIWVAGFPRSGNTWLARLLGDVLNSPIDSRLEGRPKPALADEGFDRTGDYLIKQQHLRYQPKSGKVVFVYRDPRDVILSIENYWQQSREEAIDWVCFGRGKNGGWPEYMRLWKEELVADTKISYEQLLEDTEMYLQWILHDLKIEPVNDIAKVVHRQSFSERKKDLSGLPYGEDIQNRALWRGTSGNWRDEFSIDELDYINEQIGDWIEELGYAAG